MTVTEQTAWAGTTHSAGEPHLTLSTAVGKRRAPRTIKHVKAGAETTAQDATPHAWHNIREHKGKCRLCTFCDPLEILDAEIRPWANL